ncbi:anaphase-promoting complex subunit 7 [Camelus ferus]|nr:anaphase-promoting complex subunit 7 [Camelus ferus]
MPRYAQLVMGPAGSGKSTYCATMVQHCEALNRSVQVVNLDPAAEHFSYSVMADIRELIEVDDVMEDNSLQFGPNGGLVFCMEYFANNFDWLENCLGHVEDDYILFDCPGQIELYTHLPVMKQLVQQLEQWEFRVCGVFLVDSQFMVESFKFISGILAALSAMVSLEIPQVNIMTKMDLLSKKAKKEIEKFLDPDMYSLLDDSTSDLRSKKFKKLTNAICGLIDDYSMVRFLPYDQSDEESMNIVLQHIDFAIQYGEDLEFKEPKAYHSSLMDPDTKLIGNMALLPIRTKDTDIVDEAIYYFKANVFFKNYEIKVQRICDFATKYQSRYEPDYILHLQCSMEKKYQLLVYHADSLFHDKEYRNAINMMLANLYKKAGQERPSVTSYKEVLRQCPLALDAILGLLSLSVKGAEVASMTMNVIQTVPNLDWLSVWIKAYAFVHTGDNSRAINTICSLEKKSLLRDNVDLLGSLADLYFRAGDNKNSVLKFEQAQMLDPYLIKGMDVYGYLLAREGRLEDVENLGCRLFNISDQHAEPWVVSGCHSFYSKRYSRALYLGAKAIQLNSNSVQALLLKGAALRNMGRVQEAIIHFREAIRLAPCRLDCYEGLIECYLASNSIREAMVMANNVYKTLGANAQTLTLLATVCLEDPVTQEKAKTLLDKALTQRPDYIKAVVKKAELLSREQKYEDGIALLRNALANQSDCVLHRILGDFLVAVNEYQEAMDQYSIALSLDPNDQKSLEGMQKMEKEESPTDATQEEDVDDMEGSGEEGDLEGSDSEAAQWADQEQWFGMQ